MCPGRLGNSTRVPAEAAPGPSNEASPIASKDIRKVSLIGPRRKSLNDMGITGRANRERQIHPTEPFLFGQGNNRIGASGAGKRACSRFLARCARAAAAGGPNPPSTARSTSRPRWRRCATSCSSTLSRCSIRREPGALRTRQAPPDGRGVRSIAHWALTPAAAFEPSAVVRSAAEELMVCRLVWGFSCQVFLFGLLPVLCSERGSAFFVPSPAIRFRERAEGVKGPKR